jgi:class 3 adenylate cyclase
MRASRRPLLAEHVETSAAEQWALATDAAMRPVAALFVTMRGFDAWAARAAPDDLKRRLDLFCTSIALRARANGGRIDQVLGHAHLVLFSDDSGSVRSAVRCGLELAALVPPFAPEGGGVVAVMSALHVGGSSTGFFGDEETATHVEAGEAVRVARGLTGTVHVPGFYVTDAVQRLVAGDPAFALALAGQAAIVGGPTVGVFRVMTSESVARSTEAGGA